MAIDVTAEIFISRPRAEVGGYAMNPENDPEWIGGIIESRTLDGPADGVGARVERVARFLGRRIEYVNEVVEHEPSARLMMRSVKGPFPMVVTYLFQGRPGGSTARIRVQGEASGFYRLAGPLLGRMVKRNITSDLGLLKRIMESHADGG